MLSVVIPAYNEKRNLFELTRRLQHVLDNIGLKYEIIFVNDGSTDNSLDLLLKLKKQCKDIRIISFEQNYGQTVAMQRGFSFAQGKIIVTLDADLQNFPEDIPLLINRLRKGYDVVCGWRYRRKDRLFSKTLPSFLSNLLVRLVTGCRLHDAGCSLRAYKKDVIKSLHLFGEMHRFIPVILAKQGIKISEVKVRHRKRFHGRTKYGFERYFRGFLDLLFLLFLSRYSRKPFHLFGFIGFLTLASGLALLFIDLAFLLFLLDIPLLSINIGPAIFISLLLIFFGLNFLILGIMSEMIFLSSDREIMEKIF